MNKLGHNILITAKDKDITYELLNNYGFNYEKIGKNHVSIIKKLLEIIIDDLKMIRIALNFKPDLFFGLASYRAAHASFILRKKCINFDDTEHSTYEQWVYLPFTDMVFTPNSFLKNLGKKQIRYNGFHQLAHLHPKYFKPDEKILKKLNIKNDEKFFFIRFIAWEAGHDLGHKGLNYENKIRLIQTLEKYGKVFINTEKKMPNEFEKYKPNIKPEELHSALYFAHLVISEGGTTATEAAVLGTPTIHFSSTGKYCGLFKDLHDNYGLIYVIENPEELFKLLEDLLKDKLLKNKYIDRRAKLLKEKISPTDLMIQYVSKFKSD